MGWSSADFMPESIDRYLYKLWYTNGHRNHDWRTFLGDVGVVLRLCERYRDTGGREWMGHGTPELDGSVEAGQMCRLRSFGNILGHPCESRMVAYPPREFGSLKRYDAAAPRSTADLPYSWLPLVPTRDGDVLVRGPKLEVRRSSIATGRVHVPNGDGAGIPAPCVRILVSRILYEAQRPPGDVMVQGRV